MSPNYISWKYNRIDTDGLDFKDVLLVPQFSDIDHRDQVDISSELFKNCPEFAPIKIPVISANMDTIATEALINAMDDHGGLGIMHRYSKTQDIIELIHSLRLDGVRRIIPSIGVGAEQIEILKQYVDNGIKAICIDIAHGHSKKMLETIKEIKTTWPWLKIIAGNVVTSEAARDLYKEGADAIKIGVGPGSVCLTRNNTGAGYPQLSAIMEIKRSFQTFGNGERPAPTLIADGGIHQIGDITKALAAGADFVMSGYLFAGCPETGSKTYSGMAGKDAQTRHKGWAKHVEGITVTVELKPSVKEILASIKEGLQSGFSYCGSRNIIELHNKAYFVICKS